MSDDNDPKGGEFPGCDGKESIILGPVQADGHQSAVYHDKDHNIRLGHIRELVPGEPLSDQAVLLQKREHEEGYDIVGSVAEMKKSTTRVATKEYRSGWDRTFRKDLN